MLSINKVGRSSEGLSTLCALCVGLRSHERGKNVAFNCPLFNASFKASNKIYNSFPSPASGLSSNSCEQEIELVLTITTYPRLFFLFLSLDPRERPWQRTNSRNELLLWLLSNSKLNSSTEIRQNI